VHAVVVVSDRKGCGEIRNSPHPLSMLYRSLAVAVCVVVIIRSMRVAVEKVVVVRLTKVHGLTDASHDLTDSEQVVTQCLVGSV